MQTCYYFHYVKTHTHTDLFILHSYLDNTLFICFSAELSRSFLFLWSSVLLKASFLELSTLWISNILTVLRSFPIYITIPDISLTKTREQTWLPEEISFDMNLEVEVKNLDKLEVGWQKAEREVPRSDIWPGGSRC